MAYQTGTVASPTALKSVIETFCTTNGWTLSGSDYLYKGQSFVKLTATGTTKLQLNTANSSDGLTTPYAYAPYIYIETANWPVTYYIATFTNPDIVICVLHYATNLIQPIIFGDIVKTHTSAYVGGNFIYAPRIVTGFESQINSIFTATDTGITSVSTIRYTSGNTIPFSQVSQSVSGVERNCAIHAEIDGNTWSTSGYVTTLNATNVRLAESTTQSFFRSPNSWNNQAQLIPIKLVFVALDSFVSYLGYMEHIRFVRVDNYEIGDIITLGSDKWKVFPWSKKDSTYRNGPGNSLSGYPDSSGTLGFAVRYDGP